MTEVRFKEGEREEIELVEIAEMTWVASNKMVTGTPRQRKTDRWRRVVREILAVKRNQRALSGYRR